MNLTINGRVVSAEPGDTIYKAAQSGGISIPSLCASDHLAPFGSCRLCLCEIEGRPGTPASCTTPVQEGMRVTTTSELVQRHRRNIVELYLSEQPEQGRQTQVLADLARSMGLETVRYRQPERRMVYEDSSNPFFSFRNNICVSCARCVRACEEVQGTNALTMLGRGFRTIPVAGAASLSGSAEGFATSNCVSCGACVKECPTGALKEKTVLEHGMPTQSVRTTCAYCGVGCAFDAGIRDGQVVQMVPADDG
ncbi:MAG: (2Fe-2S)-binding protein, partial [Nitrospirae bacterium]|nr:(2Fe-2S)-binding protein [Nitrospirota bacterium]